MMPSKKCGARQKGLCRCASKDRKNARRKTRDPEREHLPGERNRTISNKAKKVLIEPGSIWEEWGKVWEKGKKTAQSA